MRDPHLKAQIKSLQISVTYQLNERWVGQWCNVLESLEREDQSLERLQRR